MQAFKPVAALLFAFGITFSGFVPAAAATEDEVRATFVRFVAAQNAHDLPAVESMLWNSPDFLWITKGTAIKGRDAALKRFEANYGGTWNLAPVMGDLRVTQLTPTVALLFVPFDLSAGPAGQPATVTHFLMNQVLLKTSTGWVVASLLPIPLPPPPPAPAASPK